MKTVFLTGATSGLGRSAALEFLRQNYQVVLIGRNETKLQNLVADLSTEEKTRAAFVVADLSHPKNFNDLYKRCQRAIGLDGPPDILINNAGMAITGRIQDIPTEALERCWQVNFGAAVAFTQQALPEMVAKNSGLIVNVTSGVAKRALPFISPYCSAKAALNSFSESLRVELSGTGVQLLVFSPGPVESGFHEATEHFGKTKLNFPPFHGKSSELIGKKLFSAVEKRKERVTLGLNATLANYLNFWLPKFTDHLIGKKYRIE